MADTKSVTDAAKLNVSHALAQIIGLAVSRSSSSNPDIVRREQAEALRVIGDIATRLDREIGSGNVRANREADIRRAICDPGRILPRGDDYREPLTQWQTRAVLAVLASGGAS